MAELLLSIHIPKTAGTSFQKVLIKEFGKGLLSHYGPSHHTNARLQSFDISEPDKLLADGVRIIHGHVKVSNTPLSKSANVISWVRDPLQRAVSQYSHLVRLATKGRRSPLLSDPSMTFAEFIEQPRTQNFMSRYLDADFPVNFAAIGVVEQFADSLDLFRARLGFALEQGDTKANENPTKVHQSYQVSSEIQVRFYELNQCDVLLYQRAKNDLSRFVAEQTR